MPGFTTPYVPSIYDSPNAVRIADLIGRQGAEQADALRRSGEIQGQMWGNIGQTIAGLPGQVQQAQKTQQENEARKMQLQEAKEQRDAQQLVDALPFYGSGQGRDALLAALPGRARRLAEKHYAEVDEQHLKLKDLEARINASNLDAEEKKQQIEDGRLHQIAAYATGVQDNGNSPTAFYAAIADMYGKGLLGDPNDPATKQKAGQYIARAIQQPAWIEGITNQFIGQSLEHKKLQTERETQKRLTAVAQASAANTAADNARADAAAAAAAAARQRDDERADAQLNLSRTREAREAAKDAAAARDVTEVTPAGLDLAALNYKKTGVMPPLGFGDKTTRQRVINRAAELTPEDEQRIAAGGHDLATNRATYKSLGDTLTALQKQQSAVGAFEATAEKNIDIFLAAAKNAVDTGSPLLNTPVRAVTGKLLGATNQAEYDAARLVAINEIAKITSNPNLTGQLSDAARAEVAAFNPANATLKQTIGVMNLLKRDMQNRRTSLTDEIASVKRQLQGGTTAQPPPAGGAAKTTAPKVDDVLTLKNGQRVRVTAVTPDGKYTGVPVP